MSGSPDEKEMRIAVTGRLRLAYPAARIIEELPVKAEGDDRRADLAVIGPDYLITVELKSKRDTLDRLVDQVRMFARYSHRVIVVADDKWWRVEPIKSRHAIWHEASALPAADPVSHLCHQWRFPEPDPQDPNAAGPWRCVPVKGHEKVNAPGLRHLLWRDELAAEAHRHGLGAAPRSTRGDLIAAMSWHMRGREITEAVCRQLRSRPFAAGDAPVRDEAAPLDAAGAP